ncbi:MAG: prepilin-type N-terminal cleavage/methylation domain-containing protein [Planctomycetota bacterium]
MARTSEIGRLRTQARARRGFTLVELLVALTVITLLIGIMLPALGSVRSTTFRVVCSSNVRQIGLGVTMYADANRGQLPSSVFVSAPNGESDIPGETTRLRIGTESSFISRARRTTDLFGPQAASKVDAVWDGLGRLFDSGTLESREVFYCPAHEGAALKSDQLERWDQPSSTINGNFQYRAEGPNGEDRLWQIVPRQTVIVSDSLRPEDELNHRDGANFLRADLAVLWFANENDKLVQASRSTTGEAWRLLDGEEHDQDSVSGSTTN